MTGDHLRPAGDHDLVDVAADQLSRMITSTREIGVGFAGREFRPWIAILYSRVCLL
jgi:hypothetical protein